MSASELTFTAALRTAATSLEVVVCSQLGVGVPVSILPELMDPKDLFGALDVQAAQMSANAVLAMEH